jgi:DNA (cytosine-5)-methyltransferase 1
MLTSVELFAGAGGLGMGLTLAGFRHLAVIERDQWACDTIRRNQARGHDLVAHWPLHQVDVRHFDYAALADRVDVVAGGPPCQPFSMGGRHRGNRDDRDMFPAMAEAVRRLRPRAFIVENVKGLTRRSFADYLDYIIARLECPEIARGEAETTADHRCRLLRYKRAGRRSGSRYDVTVHLVNAADYGVPQQRARVFVIGIRDDLSLSWQFPRPTHSREALLHDQWISCRYWNRHDIPRAAWPLAPGTRAALREAPPLCAWRTVRDALHDLPDPEFDPVPSRLIADHRFQPGVKFYPGHTGSALDLPAKTLKAGDHGVPGGENAMVRGDGTGRYFTVRESARLQTFRDDYVFAGAWSEAMRQLGNAVPVVLAHAVAASLAAALTGHDSATRDGASRDRRDDRRDDRAVA